MTVVSDSPTLRALLARTDLRLRLEAAPADEDALDRPVRWVHSSDLADPTPFLSDGLVLLTTGTQFQGADEEDYSAYVRRLAARGVLGLGFGTEVVREGIPPALADACRDAGLALFEVPYRTPFIAVARANAEAIAAQAYARRSWALAAQRAISLAALRPDGLGATLAELSRQLDAWVGLFDATGSLTREHPPGALDADALAQVTAEAGTVLRRGTRAGSSLRIGDTPFRLQTLGRTGHLRGVIAIASGDLDQEERGVVTSVIAMAGLALEQNQGLSRARASLRAGVVQSLLSDDPTLARRIARDAWRGLPHPPITVAMTDAATARDHTATEWLELKADESRGEVFYGRGDDGLVIVTSADHDGIVGEFAELFGVGVGVSRPAPYSSFSAAVREARVARDRGAAAGSRVSRFGDSGVGSVLSAEPSDEARAVAAALLAPLDEYDAAHAGALRETVRTWLEQDCSHEATSRALGIHRHTVRARLATAQRVLGRDLSSFPERAEVWAALSVASV